LDTEGQQKNRVPCYGVPVFHFNDLAPVDDAEAVNRNDTYNQMVDKKVADPEYQ